MTRFAEFIYESYYITDTGLGFKFTMGNNTFTPHWGFNKVNLPADKESKAILDCAVFNLGMAELVSYWKAACPPVIKVNCGCLDEAQIRYWKDLYKNGLGEFFYRNNITAADNFVEIIPAVKQKPNFAAQGNFIPQTKQTFPPCYNSKTSFPEPCKAYGAMIPVGGGKDSVVTMELLKETVNENLAYMINGRKAAEETAKLGGFTENNTLNVTRVIDKRLLELNAEGYLNGHTPFSAIVAFSSFLFALLYNKRYVILSNESSANEGNTDGVNHQYSKSVAFEKNFREYTGYCFGNNVPEYFSLLRCWNEWRITKEFVKYPQYFGVFQSCNAGTKMNIWCNKCPKCLYVCVMLSAFLDNETLISIFGADLLNDTGFSQTLDALVFSGNVKPFECVGTYDEIRYALQTACKLRIAKGERLPKLYENIYGKLTPCNNTTETYFDETNFIPEEYKRILNFSAEANHSVN
jgi:hypothetical protein